MRVLQVHPTYSSINGGVERHIQGLSKYLVKRGHEVTILTCENGGSYREGKVFVRREGNLRYWIESSSFDIVHIHGYRVFWANIFGLLYKVNGKAIVMTTHGIYPSRSTTDAILKKLYDLSIGRINIEIFDAFIALTPETQQSLLFFGAKQEKIHIIPNALDIELYQDLPPGDFFFKKFGISDESKILLYVGRIDWNKGLDIALKALAQIKNEIPEALLLIIGQDCGYVPALKELSSNLGILDRVIFTGVVSDNILRSAYSVADIFILPSIYEGLPTAVLEAMACGVPVIAAKTGGTPYLITHGENGFLFTPYDVENLSKLMLSTLRDEKGSEIIAETARNFVKEYYSWKNVAQKIENVYKRVIKGNQFAYNV